MIPEHAELIVIRGAFAGTTVRLGAGTVVVGRASECDLVLRTGSGVSRRHCKVQFLGNRFVVVDLDSRNGTIVNGQSVERKVLEPGDRIEVGDEVIEFVVRESATTEPGVSATSTTAEPEAEDAQAPLVVDSDEVEPLPETLPPSVATATFAAPSLPPGSPRPLPASLSADSDGAAAVPARGSASARPASSSPVVSPAVATAPPGRQDVPASTASARGAAPFVLATAACGLLGVVGVVGWELLAPPPDLQLQGPRPSVTVAPAVAASPRAAAPRAGDDDVVGAADAGLVAAAAAGGDPGVDGVALPTAAVAPGAGPNGSGAADIAAAGAASGASAASDGAASVGAASVGAASVGAASVGAASVGAASVGAVSVGAASVGSVADAVTDEALLAVRARGTGRARQVLVEVGAVVASGTPLVVVETDGGGSARKLAALRHEEAEFAGVDSPRARDELATIRAEIRRLEARAKGTVTMTSDKAGTVVEVLIAPGDIVRDATPIVRVRH
jgi:biotin carboxyl carrier protein